MAADRAGFDGAGDLDVAVRATIYTAHALQEPSTHGHLAGVNLSVVQLLMDQLHDYKQSIDLRDELDNDRTHIVREETGPDARAGQEPGTHAYLGRVVDVRA